MNRQLIISQAKLAGNEECKVFYNKTKDMVELEVGGTSLRFAVSNFFMMHEMMRKAAAKLVMKTELHHTLNVLADARFQTKLLIQNELYHA